MLFLLYSMATSLYFELKGKKKEGGNLGTSLLMHTRRHHKFLVKSVRTTYIDQRLLAT